MAARWLGVSRQRVYQLAQAGKIGWQKRDGLVLLNAVSVEARMRMLGKGERDGAGETP